ncbi:MAG: uracil-DNA glycosylase [Chlamydiae bacterium]|nr:uracil-DNA glycosylase [Chlamydiota bacterium]
MISNNSWKEFLEEERKKPYMQSLSTFLLKEKNAGEGFFPPEEKIFSAFSSCEYEKVKVVIIGQDPYHGENQANGLAFSVEKSEKIPPSLKNIYKELVEDVGIHFPKHGDLTCWAKQGVLLLNATLTVQKSKPKSHYGKGWEIFTDEVVKKLLTKNDPLVFLLWGESAKQKYSAISSKNNDHHLVLKAAHPSPFSFTKFKGCAHFSKANAFLKMHNKEPVDWSIV